VKVTTAVITAAGFGTRMLPVTSAIQKVMLPILNRPVIDYIVEDCLAAGVKNIIFVINPGTHDLQDYYVGNPNLERLMKHFGKTAAVEELAAIHAKATFTFVEQSFETVGYGTNPPLLVAAPHLPKDEAFIVTYGDAWLQRSDGTSEFAQLVRTYQESGADAAISGFELPTSKLSAYGVLGIKKVQDREYLDDFVEKPAPGQEPSNLANLGFYIFPPEIMPYAKAVKKNQTGEYYLTDAVLEASRKLSFVIHRAEGEFLDAGNLKSWLETNLKILKSRPELASQLTTVIRDIQEDLPPKQ
jgi:UTP--glucose-1-phosphate uridylyltransferase